MYVNNKFNLIAPKYSNKKYSIIIKTYNTNNSWPKCHSIKDLGLSENKNSLSFSYIQKLYTLTFLEQNVKQTLFTYAKSALNLFILL